MDSALPPVNWCIFDYFADKIQAHNCRDLLMETTMTSTDRAITAELIMMPTMIFSMVSMSIMWCVYSRKGEIGGNVGM